MPEHIGGDRAGVAYGRLGGILYFEKYELYCLVYARAHAPENLEMIKFLLCIIYIQLIMDLMIMEV